MYLYISKKKLWILSIMLLIIIVLIILMLNFNLKAVFTNVTSKSYIALVIDDVGDCNRDGLDELLKLDIPITVAIMPFAENTEVDAKKCHEANVEIILHLPMGSHSGCAKWLGPKYISCDKSDEDNREILKSALTEVKYAKGINNHMGSKAMKDDRVVREILTACKENNLFFLDSKTGSYSVAEKIANELGVVYFGRDVFLDHSKKIEDIEKAMDKLGEIALKRGYAIGIGHVGGQGGKVTMKAIDKKSKELENKGIEFIFLSELENILKDK